MTFTLSKSCQTSSGGHSASYSMDTRVLSLGQGGGDNETARA